MGARSRWATIAGLGLIAAGVLGGCPQLLELLGQPPGTTGGTSGTTTGTTTGNEPGAGGPHADVKLLDKFGNPITASSRSAFSPRKTCGACHDIDTIASGYHFQQGRTDADGNVQVRDDFFGDGRPWVRSDGMYGKW